MDIYEYVETIETKNDFNIFLKMLIIDLKEHKEEWDNSCLEDFLQGIYGYSFDEDEKNPSWKGVAKMLLGGIVYD